jgi:hypothetical protein
MTYQVLSKESSSVVASRVSEAQAQLLELIASAEGVSRSTYLRDALELQLQADAGRLLEGGELAARTAAKVRRALEGLQVS